MSNNLLSRILKCILKNNRNVGNFSEAEELAGYRYDWRKWTVHYIMEGRTEETIEGRIQKARGAFQQLWTSPISTEVKLRIFHSNVKSTLLYGYET